MTKKVVAWDFDGVLNKLPKPFELFMRHLGTKPFEKGWFKTLEGIFIREIIGRLPFILDDEIFKKIDWNNDNYVITGRLQRHEEIAYTLNKFPFVKFYMRNSVSVTESQYKIRINKKIKSELYVEDRLRVIRKLRENGINVKDVRKWTKE